MNHWITPQLVDLGAAGLSRAKVKNSSVSESRIRHYAGARDSEIKHYQTFTGGPS